MLNLPSSLRAKTGKEERTFPNNISRLSLPIFFNLNFDVFHYHLIFLKPYQLDFASPFPIFKKKMRHAKKGITQITKPLRQRGLTGLFCFHFAFLKDIPKWSTRLIKKLKIKKIGGI